MVGSYNSENLQPAEEWRAAALNGADLLYQKFGKRPVQLHRHVPHALKKSVAIEMEKNFKPNFDAMRKNKFRGVNDISPTSFLYHHFSFYKGHSIRRDCDSLLVNSANFNRYHRELKLGKAGKFFCLNEGDGSHRSNSFQTFKIDILEELFPIKASCEVSIDVRKDEHT